MACVAHTFSLINWVDQSLDYGIPSDPLSRIFCSDESIMDIMMSNNASWDEHHHHSSLPYSIEDDLNDVYLPNFVEPCMHHVTIVGPFVK